MIRNDAVMLSAVRVSGLCLVALLLTSCTRKLGVDVVLIAPDSPFPFLPMEEVRTRALVSGRIVDVGSAPWDQGPHDFAQTIDPLVERIVVEGRMKDGTLVASGVSAPLDLLRTPPKGPIPIIFTLVGQLSPMSQHATARAGGRAVALDGERVLFAGGTDASGNVLKETEIFDARAMAASAGPPLGDGRTGAFALRKLPGGRVVVALGDSRRISVLDPDALSEDVASDLVESSNPGASVAAVSDTLVVIAGGDTAGGDVSADVYRFNPDQLAFESKSTIDDPRSHAGAEVVGGSRVLFVGGRSTLDPTSALRDASVFDPSGGFTSPSPIPLGHRALDPAVKATLAESVIVAADGTLHVSAVVVEPGRSLFLGDTSTVASLPHALGGGELIDLLDGTLLLVPSDETADLAWIHLLPLDPEPVTTVPRPPGAGRLVGDRGLVGTAILRTDDGRYFWFNAGTSAVFASYGVDEALRGTAGRGSAGIFPLRPASWTLDQSGLTGALPPGAFAPGVAPKEYAVLGSTSFVDFDVTLTLRLPAPSEAALLIGLDNGAFDEVAFTGGTALVARSDANGMRNPLACDSLATPQLLDGAPHRVRIHRTGDDLRIDLQADGSDDLACNTPNAPAGLLAFGVINGHPTLAGFEINTTTGF
jgi:hypothetical protein